VTNKSSVELLRRLFRLTAIEHPHISSQIFARAIQHINHSMSANVNICADIN